MKISKAGELLQQVLMPENYITEFAGILTLDLPNQQEHKRYQLYANIQKHRENIQFEKIDNLDTIWAVKCSGFITKKEANNAILTIFEQVILDLSIKRLNLSFNLSLSYLNDKYPYQIMQENPDGTEILINYFLYKNNPLLIQKHIEPLYPVTVKWNSLSEGWLVENHF